MLSMLALLLQLTWTVLASGKFAFTVRVGPHTEPLELSVVVANEDFERESDFPISPSDFDKTERIEFYGLPDGEYFVVAQLTDRNGKVVDRQVKPLLVNR